MICNEMRMRMTCKHEYVTRVMFINDNCRTSGTSCILYDHAFGGIPLSHHEGTDVYIQMAGQRRYVVHSAAVTVLVLTGPGGPPEHAQRCAN